MFVKVAIAIALILGMASEAVATPKQKHNTSRTYVYDARGQHAASSSRVTRTHAKTAHAKTAQKHKRRTRQAYASYETREWSFGSAASAVIMVNPKQFSNRQYELYNTRAQYSGPASRAAATARQGHSSNPAYDVYDMRGWYIGSDPDPTVRFMLARDPSNS